MLELDSLCLMNAMQGPRKSAPSKLKQERSGLISSTALIAAPDALSLLGSNEIATLVEAVGSASFFATLHALLKHVTPFQNFIVIFFEVGRTAEILHANLELGELRRKMTPYLNGLYALDPFFIACSSGDERLFIVMDEVAPEEFVQTEFYRTYYMTVDLSEETRFLIPVGPDRWLHLLVERERPAPRFSAADRAALRAVSQSVRAFARKHYELSLTKGGMHPANRALSANLLNVISSICGGVLSRREVEIVESLLQGHSPKSVARRLNISRGTVANHKRHIYEKLGIHSQAQLFNLVLAGLFGWEYQPDIDDELQPE